MKKILSLLTLLFCLYGCKKNGVPVSPEKGDPMSLSTVLKGITNPAGAVSNITLNDGRNVPINIIPDASGAFLFKGLNPGTYTLSYIVLPIYQAQAPHTLTVAAGQTLDMGIIFFKAGIGTLEGSIAPAGAAVKVTIINTETKTIYVSVPDATSGKYKFDPLPAGDYRISYDSNGSSIPPPDGSFTLKAGQSMTLPLIVFKTSGTTATISGEINPSGSANVYLLNPSTNYSVIIYPKLGKFTSPELLPGTYEISFPAGAPYQSPPKRTVVLNPGENLDLGKIEIPKGLYLVKLIVNGAATIVGMSVANIKFNEPNFSVSASNTDAGLNHNNTSVNFSMAMDNLTSPGTYELEGNATSFISYQRGSSFNPSRWNMDNGGKATVIITAIDRDKRIITGSFSAILKPARNASGDLVITNGVINFTY